MKYNFAKELTENVSTILQLLPKKVVCDRTVTAQSFLTSGAGKFARV
jgi:hypothetical protein